MTNKLRRHHLAYGLAFSILVVAPAHAGTCYDHATLTYYDPVLLREMQKRLHDKGFYSGKIDGKVGSETRAALARLTGLPKTTVFRLQTYLVEKLFGPDHQGIYYSEDQDRLMEQLGLSHDPNYQDPCRVKIYSE